MNNLTRILLTTASVTALVISAQNTAQADPVTPNGGSGTITYGAGGFPIDATGQGGGFQLATAPNDTVTLDSLMIDKTAAAATLSGGEGYGPVNALEIDNATGTLNVTLSGTGSTLTEESADQAAALYINNADTGLTTLDTTGASSPSTFTGTQGLVVLGGGDVSITTASGDQIIANEDGNGFDNNLVSGGDEALGGGYTAGIFASGAGNVTIINNATIESDGTYNFDAGIAAAGANITITNNAAGNVSGLWAGVLGDTGSGTLTVYNYGIISGGGAGIDQLGSGTLTVHNYDGGVIQATGGVGEGNGIIAYSGAPLNVTNDSGAFIVGATDGIYGNNAADSITNLGTIAAGTYSGGMVTVEGSDGIGLASGGTIVNGMADGSVTPLIEGSDSGIYTGGSANVTNYANATIQGGSTGVYGSAGLTLTNLGTVTAGENGVYLNGGTSTINNAGTISASDGTGLYVSLGSSANVTNDSAGSITGGANATSGYGVIFRGESGTLDNYGSVTGTAGGVQVAGGANAAINLFAGSTTGAIDLTGDGGGSTVSLYTGTGTGNAGLTDSVTGAVEQANGTLGAAVYGNITGNTGDVLALRGTGDGSAANGAAGQIDLSSAPNGTGVISGFNEIDKDDSGTWQFNNAGGNATHQSPTIVLNQGTIQAMGEGAFGGGTINVAGVSTIEYSASGFYDNAIGLNIASPNATNAVTLSADDAVTANVVGVISGTNQSIIINGPGTVELSHTETYTGATTIANGTLMLGEAGDISSSSVVNLTSATSVLNTTIAGTTPTIHNLTGVSGSAVQFGAKGLTVNNTAATTFAGTISGAGSMTNSFELTGTGTLALTGTNTYTAPTDIEGGTLALNGTGSIADSENVNIASGATFDISGTTAGASVEGLTGAGNVTLGAQTLTLTSGEHAFNGTIQGTGGLTIAGGEQALHGANTYTGQTTISSGSLTIGEGGSLASGNNVEIDGGSLYFYGVANQTLAAITQSGGTFSLGEGASVTVGTYNQTSGSVSLSGESGGGHLTATTFNQMGGNVTLDEGEVGSIGSSLNATTYNLSNGNLLVDGGEGTAGGTLTAGTFNQTGGNVTIYGGANSGGGTLTATTYNQSAGTITLQGGGGSYGTLNAATFNQTGGSVAINYDGLMSVGALTGSGGAIVMDGGELQVGSGNVSSTYGGSISSVGLGYIDKVGTGTLTLSGDNSNYDGATQIEAGTLQAGSTSAFGGAYLIVDGTGTLDLNGYDNAIFYLTGNGAVTDSSTAPATLTLYNGGEFAGSIQDGAGKLSLEIAEGGRLNLRGVNTYSGTTTVDSAASLFLYENTSIANSAVIDNGTVDISHGTAPTVTFASLSGNGTVYMGGETLVLNTANGTFSGVLQDGGEDAQTGANLEIAGGREALSGTNTFTGTTTIDAGAVLQLGAGGTTGSVAGPLIDNGTLAFDLSTPTTISTALAGTGGLEVDMSTVTITGAQTTLSGASLIAPNATLALSGAGTLNVPLTDDGTFDISGSAADQTIKSLAGNGTVTLGAHNLTLAAANATFSGAINGTGGLTTAGGTETLSGTNGYTGATAIGANSTLALAGNGSIAASSGVADAGTFDISATTAGATVNTFAGAGNLVLGGQTLTIANANGTFSGIASGAGGGITIAGGTETVSGANTYSGSTTIASGATLALSGTGSLASSLIEDDGTFDISGTANGASTGSLAGSGGVYLGSKTLTINNGDGTFSGNITDGGLDGMVIVAGGTETLTGDNTYGGGTTVDSGATLVVGNPDSLGTGTITFAADSTIDFTSNLTLTNNAYFEADAPVFDVGDNTVTYSGAASGPGDLAVTGNGGTLILTNTGNTYAGGTEVYGGSTLNIGADSELGGVAHLQLGDAATTGTLQLADSFNLNAGRAISLLAGGGAIDTQAFNTTVAQGITGAGGLTKEGSGTLILTGANTYAGPTTIAGGTVQVGAGGTTGSVAGDIADNGALAFDRSNAVTYGGVISGTGTLAQSGSGTLTLGGTSTLTGPTSVNAGTLIVAGSIGSSAVTVNSGATLGGTGTVGATTVASGATLSPGTGGVGTLSVNGKLALASGAITDIDVTPTAADKIAVSGTATLGGTLAITSAAGTYTSGTDYTIVSSTGLTGQFATVTGTGIAGFDTTVEYSPTAVTFDITPATGPTGPTGPVTVTYAFHEYGTTQNEIAAGTALEGADPSGALYTATGAAVTGSPATAPDKLNQLTGELHASARSALIEDGRAIRESVLDHLAQDPDGMTVWGTGFASDGRIDATANTGALHRTNGGFVAGVDTPVSDWVSDLRVGLAGAYNADHASISGLGSSLHGSTGHVIAYAGWTGGPWVAKGGIDLGWGNTHISRDVSFLAETDHSSQTTQTTQFFGDAGYNIALEPVLLQPYADLANINVKTGGFTETGGLAALTGSGTHDNVTYSTLGARASIDPWTMGGWSVTPRADIGWQHAFNRLMPSDTVAFAGNGQDFSVAGAPLDKDAAALQGGVDIAITPQAVISLTYDGTFSSKVTDNTFRGGFIWKF